MSTSERDPTDGTAPHWKFAGFRYPTTTPVPDQFFDELLARLAPAEIVVCLYIIRRTFGFKKDEDNISLRQLAEGIVTKDGRVLDTGTGLSKATVARALNSLEEKLVIVRTRRSSQQQGDQPTTYRLNMLAPLSQFETPRVSPTRQAVSHQRDTQETVRQQTANGNTPVTSSLPLSVSEDLSSSKFERANARTNTDLEEEETEEDTVDQPNSQGKQGGFQPLGQLLATQQARDFEPQSPAKVSPTRGREGSSAVPPLRPDTATLARQRAAKRSLPTSDTDARQAIRAYIEQYAEDLGDEAPLSSTVTQAMHLFEQSGLTISGFIRQLQDAHRETQRRSGTIRKQRTRRGPGSSKNKMPFYFAILRDYLGLRAHPEPEASSVTMPAQPASTREARWTPSRPRRRTVGGPLVRVVQHAHNDDDEGDDDERAEPRQNPAL